jgi:hypothetical protein
MPVLGGKALDVRFEDVPKQLTALDVLDVPGLGIEPNRESFAPARASSGYEDSCLTVTPVCNLAFPYGATAVGGGLNS